MNTVQNTFKRRKYSSDMSNNGWNKLKGLLPTPKTGTSAGGRPPLE